MNMEYLDTQLASEEPRVSLNLPENAVHIWRAALDLPSHCVETLHEKLSIDERRKAESFRFERDRNRFIVSVGILRTILGYYIAVDPRELQFCYGSRGKPRLQGGSGKTGIQFNLSHSEGLALYAFCRDREVGIDVEYIRDVPEMAQIVQQFFSAGERIAFNALPDHKKREAFFNCWTRKEAFIKAIGEGLYQPLDAFDVSVEPGAPARLMTIRGNSAMASRYLIKDLQPAPGFVAALAQEGKSSEIRFWQWANGSGSWPEEAGHSRIK
jgi:4'-phosphopantetheinyl transferase